MVADAGAIAPPAAENDMGTPTRAVRLLADRFVPAELRVKLAVIAAMAPVVRVVGLALVPSTSQGLVVAGPAIRPLTVLGSRLLPHQVLLASTLASAAVPLERPLPLGALLPTTRLKLKNSVPWALSTAPPATLAWLPVKVE